MDSILTSIKKLLNIPESDTNFDTDIIIHINTVFMVLSQLGIGPSDGFSIEDETATWSDYVSGKGNIEAVKTYIYLKVRLIFDPPASSAVTDAINKNISELEWRLNFIAEADFARAETSEIKTRVSDLEKKVSEHETLFKTLVGEV